MNVVSTAKKFIAESVVYVVQLNFICVGLRDHPA